MRLTPRACGSGPAWLGWQLAVWAELIGSSTEHSVQLCSYHTKQTYGARSRYRETIGVFNVTMRITKPHCHHKFGPKVEKRVSQPENSSKKVTAMIIAGLDQWAVSTCRGQRQLFAGRSSVPSLAGTCSRVIYFCTIQCCHFLNVLFLKVLNESSTWP